MSLFILSTERCLETFSRRNGIGISSESFALSLIISVVLTNK